MMVTMKTSDKVLTKSGVKVGKLSLNKETIKDLTAAKQKQVKGGSPQETKGRTCTCDGC
jgi:hypothetical protein